MPRLSFLETPPAATALALMLVVPGVSQSVALDTREPRTNPPGVTQQVSPVTTKSVEKTDDASCPTGQRWVTYTYEDGKLTNTYYGKCV